MRFRRKEYYLRQLLEKYKMVDFKIIVPAKGRVMLALAELGMYVAGDSEYFHGLENVVDFKEWEFITAVPVEIALDADTRTRLMNKDGECRFVVTEVTPERVNTLKKYGYTLLYEGQKAPTDPNAPAKIAVMDQSADDAILDEPDCHAPCCESEDEERVKMMDEEDVAFEPDLANVPVDEDYLIYNGEKFTVAEVRKALDMYVYLLGLRELCNFVAPECSLK